MKVEIEKITTQMVTPSSPTPPHLNTHKLSFLDQIMPHFLTAAYFFYPPAAAANNNDNNLFAINAQRRSNHLKKSLSQALTLFYPLAGRLVVSNNGHGNNSYHVNCNDEGVTYVEAQANCMLSDVINDAIPIPAEEEELFMGKLLPCDPSDDARDLLMVVQATLFCCGGLALGIGFSHRVVDGFSVVMFLKCWASFSRGGGGGGGGAVVKSPKFECAALFPPKDDLVISDVVARVEKKENVVTKKFMFSSQKISELREKYACRSTKIETLTAFIGNRFMVATTATSKVSTLRIFVDIRTRVVPPLSEYHFGNTVIPATITLFPFNSPEKEDEDASIVAVLKKLRDAIRNVNGDSVAKLRQQQRNDNEPQEDQAVMLSFTNFCNFPVHEFNFGWGIPMFIAGPNIPVNNMVFFSNSLCGGGNIDAWVNLKEEDMIKFEADSELLEYVSRPDNTKFLSKM